MNQCHGVLEVIYSRRVADDTIKWMDAWMIFDFTSSSNVFQSYQDDGRMMMKGCVQWNPVYGWEDRYISRPALNPLSYRGSLPLKCLSVGTDKWANSEDPEEIEATWSKYQHRRRKVSNIGGGGGKV